MIHRMDKAGRLLLLTLVCLLLVLPSRAGPAEETAAYVLDCIGATERWKERIS